MQSDASLPSVDFDEFSMDNLLGCLTGGEGDDAQQFAEGPQSADSHGPKARGGFAATGKAAPLRFEDLAVGMIIVRHSTAEAAVAKPQVPAITQTGKDLLAALRKRMESGQAPTSGQVEAQQKKPDIFVSDQEAEFGLESSQLLALCERIFIVAGLSAVDKAVVVENASRQPSAIPSFGRISANPSDNAHYYRAGALEEAFFNRWRDDPSELAVIGTKRPRTSDEGAAITSFQSILTPISKQEPLWWVVRGLLVRYVPADETHPQFGVKGTVVECSRKDGRVTLKVNAAKQQDHTGSSFTMLRCVLGEIETVVPKVGERGMVLRPSDAGELVTVQAKNKDPTNGDPILTVLVNGESVDLKAEEICVLSVI
eukprot:GILI01023156.1.p1 GENE.GILI01023156.1~~GILI01023156.1.p1  ORF type:complete len:370 (+),score=50.03 GILI01023156.1:43-1152(+)